MQTHVGVLAAREDRSTGILQGVSRHTIVHRVRHAEGARTGSVVTLLVRVGARRHATLGVEARVRFFAVAEEGDGGIGVLCFSVLLVVVSVLVLSNGRVLAVLPRPD